MCHTSMKVHQRSWGLTTGVNYWKPLPKFRILSFLALVFCYACSYRAQEPGPLTRDLITETPCTVPCWQGIVPGQTTEQEAIDILFSDLRPEYVRDPQIYREDRDMGTTIRWMTKGAKVPPALPPPGHWPLSEAPWNEVRIRDDVVDRIYLTLDAGLTAQMVIEEWGTPSQFSAGVYGVDYLVARAGLLYPEQGVSFSVYLDPRDDPLELRPDSQVVGATLYPPVPTEQWLANMRTPGKLYDWPGFGPIDSAMLQ